MVYMSMNDFDRGLAAFEQSYNLNPNDPTMLALYGSYLPYFGRAKKGAEMVNRALRIDPHPPKYYCLEVDPFYATGMYDQVGAMLHRYEGDLPWWSLFVLDIRYAQMGQPKEAAAAVSDLTRHFPDPSFERLVSENGGFKDAATEALYREGARRAGIPECATTEDLRKYPKMTHLAFCDTKRATN